MASLKRLATLITISFLLGLASCCEYEHDFDYSGYDCKFFLNYTDSNCSTFQLDHCQWTECVSYYSDGNNTYCDQYQDFTNTNWDTCTKQCCDDSVTYPQTSDSIGQCQAYLDKVRIRTIIIICSIVGSIVLVVAIVFLCACCRGSHNCCNNCSLRCDCNCDCLRFSNPEEPNNREIAYQMGQYPPQIQSSSSMPKSWKEGEILPINDTDCSICLNMNPNLLTDCHHLFHPNCFAECLKKKVQCILCRNQNFKVFKIYCTKCFKNCYQIQWENLQNITFDAPDQCNQCSGKSLL